MKKGFTLLELMIVLIIVGVLSTLGIMQYQATIEKARGAEARQVIGSLRSSCAAIWMQDRSTVGCTIGNLGISASATVVVGEIPGTGGCWATNYFQYNVAATPDDDVLFTATRCIADGKAPQGGVANNLTLATNYTAGTDVWASTGGY